MYRQGVHWRSRGQHPQSRVSGIREKHSGKGKSAYADYMVLEFCKDGTFREASNVFHITDDMDIKDLSSALTLRLKSSLDSVIIEEIYRKLIYKKEDLFKPEMLRTFPDSITQRH